LTAQGIYFLDPDEVLDTTIKFFDFASRKDRPIARIEKDRFPGITHVAASPDGQWFLFAVQDFPSNIMLVENFR
jgi:hypothetical protein